LNYRFEVHMQLMSPCFDLSRSEFETFFFGIEVWRVGGIQHFSVMKPFSIKMSLITLCNTSYWGQEVRKVPFILLIGTCSLGWSVFLKIFLLLFWMVFYLHNSWPSHKEALESKIFRKLIYLYLCYIYCIDNKNPCFFLKKKKEFLYTTNSKKYKPLE
jgi:hypothetical protein